MVLDLNKSQRSMVADFSSNFFGTHSGGPLNKSRTRSAPTPRVPPEIGPAEAPRAAAAAGPLRGALLRDAAIAAGLSDDSPHEERSTRRDGRGGPGEQPVGADVKRQPRGKAVLLGSEMTPLLFQEKEVRPTHFLSSWT